MENSLDEEMEGVDCELNKEIREELKNKEKTLEEEYKELPEDLGVRIVSEDEAMWEKIIKTHLASIDSARKEIVITKCFLKASEKALKRAQKKANKGVEKQ